MNELNMDRFTKALSEILSRKYDAKITITAIPRETGTGTPKNGSESTVSRSDNKT